LRFIEVIAGETVAGRRKNVLGRRNYSVARPEDGRQDMAESEKGRQESGRYVCSAGSEGNGRRVFLGVAGAVGWALVDGKGVDGRRVNG
jgi:hypothetical protein